MDSKRKKTFDFIFSLQSKIFLKKKQINKNNKKKIVIYHCQNTEQQKNMMRVKRRQAAVEQVPYVSTTSKRQRTLIEKEPYFAKKRIWGLDSSTPK